MPPQAPEAPKAPQAPPPLVTLVLQKMCSQEEDDQSSEAVEVFRHVARWIPRSISPFLDINATMNAAIPTDEPLDEIDINNFNRIIKMHSAFPQLITAFQEEPDAFEKFVTIMVRAAGDARAQDTNSLRYEIPKYIPLDYKTNSVMPPITGGTKSGRGFSHPATARLLCPLRYLDRLQEDPVLFKNQIENGTLKLRARDERNWPSFLYPEDAQYNELELDNGLFCGHVFIRGLRAIYTGQSSAFTGHRSASKRSQAEKHGMREVFPEAIAYAAVQCYYSLSSMEGWDTEDRFFKLDVFFDKCVQLFTEDPEDEWVINTLKFLTSQMPALTRKSKRPLDDSSEEEDASDGEQPMGILAQRAEKRRAAEEAAIQAEQTLTDTPGDTTGRPATPPNTSPPASPSRGRSPSDTSHPPHGSNSPPSFRSSLPESLRDPSRTSNAQASTNGRNQVTQSRVPQPSNSHTSASQGPAPPPPAPPTSANRGGAPPVASKKKNAGRKPAKRPRR